MLLPRLRGLSSGGLGVVRELRGWFGGSVLWLMLGVGLPGELGVTRPRPNPSVSADLLDILLEAPFLFGGHFLVGDMGRCMGAVAEAVAFDMPTSAHVALVVPHGSVVDTGAAEGLPIFSVFELEGIEL